MKDAKKTKKQLLEEMGKLQRRIAELETKDDGCKRVEKRLHLFFAMVEQSTDSIVYTDSDNRIIYINAAARELFGWSLDELRGKTPDIFNAEPLSDEIQADIYSKVSSGEMFFGECLNKRKDGSTFYCQFKVSPLLDKEGEIYGYMGLQKDITERKKAEEALRERQNLLQAIMDNITSGVVIKDTKGRYLMVNRVMENVVGMETGEIIGKTPIDIYPPEIAEKIIADDMKVIESKRPLTIEEKLRRNGDSIYLTTKVPLFDVDGKPSGLCGLFTDITERKRAEKQQELSLRIFQSLNKPQSHQDEIREVLAQIKESTGFEAVGIRLQEGEDFPYFVTEGFPLDFVEAENYLCDRDQAGELIRDSEGNPYLECMCGNVICGRTDPSLPFFTEGGSFWANSTSRLLAETSDEDRQARTRNRCNGEGYESVALIPLRSEKEVVGLLQLNDSRPNCFTKEMIQFFEGIGTSIGIAIGSRRTREELNRERDLQNRIMETSPAGIVIIDCMGKITLANSRAEEVLGLSRDEITQRAYNDPEWRITDFEGHPYPDDELPFQQVMNTGLPVYDVHHAIEWPDGKRVLLSINSTPLFDDSGEVNAVVNTVEDITGRILKDKQLKQSEKNYRELYENAPVGYHEVDTRGIILRVNHTEAEMLGYRPEEMIGRPVFDFHPPQERKKSRRAFRAKIKGDKNNIVALERKLVCRNGSIIESLQEDRLIFDDKGRVTGVRITVQDITERKRAEEERRLLSTAMEQSDEVVVITDTKGAIQYVNPAFEKVTGYPAEETLGQNPSILSSGSHDEVFYSKLWDTISSGEVWKGRFINRKKDGTSYHEDATISPVKNSSGKIVSYVCVKRDITRQLELENQLQHAQKMESIGLLAGGVAHDFNNLLTSIMGFSSLMKKASDIPEKQKRRIAEIEKASQRGAEITRQLLTFSRKQPPKLATMNLNDCVNQTIRFLKRGFGPNITFETELDDALSNVNADSTQIQQVLMNLCINAQDAMSDGGKILIKTSNIDIGIDYAAKYVYAKIGPHVLVSVTDTGTGMDKETQTRIFEPFFTTKEIGKGTGLGLSIVYGIVKNHSGFINVYSEPGRGTTFRVYLPRTDVEKDDSSTAKSPVMGGSESILIVDDDEMIINLAASILEEYGYKCLTAVNGPEALDIYRQHFKKIDLVLTDIVMPRMSGQELCGELHKINPQVLVIMSSGFSVQDEKALFEKGTKAFISKPYQERSLVRLIREVLDKATRQKR